MNVISQDMTIIYVNMNAIVKDITCTQNVSKFIMVKYF